MNLTWFKGKMFGMPRWAFIALLIAGVAVGIYYRRRRAEQEGEQEAEPTDPEYGGEPSSLSEMAGEPGLAGVGVVSPPGGVYPVTTPLIPEGVPEILTGLTAGLVEVASREPVVVMPDAVDPPPPPVVNITVPKTGGGAPKRGAPHRPVTRRKPAQSLPARRKRATTRAKAKKSPGGRRVTAGERRAIARLKRR
jgi:hypothetical protein